MKEVQFDINEVVQKLSMKIGKLEAELAFERSATEAYMRRIEELEQEKEDDDANAKEVSEKMNM